MRPHVAVIHAASELEPLRRLTKLRDLALANGHPEQFADGASVRPFEFLDNPIDDARPLNELPLLTNVMTTADRLAVNFTDLQDAASRLRGQATRLEFSNRFDVTPEAGGASVRFIMATFMEILEAARRLVLMSAFIPSLNALAIAYADPDNGDATLKVAESKAVLDAEPVVAFAIAVLTGLEPTMIFEATTVD